MSILKRQPKQQLNLRLSLEARRLLELLAQHLGVSQTAVIEIVMRDKAKEMKIT